MGRENDMQALADALWEYLKPKIQKRDSNALTFYRAKVTTKAAGGVIGVTAPYDTEVKLPYVGSAASLALNAECIVLELGSASNAIVLGNGKLTNL